MLDLETLGKRPGCVIRSIGAVGFDPFGTECGRGFYANITRESCLEAGLHVDPSTEAWWEKQSPAARARLEQDQRPLREVAQELEDRLRSSSVEQIWSHGAGFDIPIWEAALHALGMQAPWKFWNARDTRTLFWLTGLDTRTVAREGTHHDALADAQHQVRCVQRAIASMRERVVG